MARGSRRASADGLHPVGANVSRRRGRRAHGQLGRTRRGPQGEHATPILEDSSTPEGFGLLPAFGTAATRVTPPTGQAGLVLPRLFEVPTCLRLSDGERRWIGLVRRWLEAGLLEPVTVQEHESLEGFLFRAWQHTLRTRFGRRGNGYIAVTIQQVQLYSESEDRLYLTVVPREPACICLEPLEQALAELDARYQLERDRLEHEKPLFGNIAVPEPMPMLSLALEVLPTLIHGLNHALSVIAPLFGPQDALALIESWAWEGDPTATNLYIEAREQLEADRKQRNDPKPVSDEEVTAYADEHLLTPNVVRSRLGSHHLDFKPLGPELVQRALECWSSPNTEDSALEPIERLRTVQRITEAMMPLAKQLWQAEQDANLDPDVPFEGDPMYAFVLATRHENDLVSEMFDEAMDLVMQSGEYLPTWFASLEDRPESLEALRVFLEVAPKLFDLAEDAMTALDFRSIPTDGSLRSNQP
jgi:hypothetical protein